MDENKEVSRIQRAYVYIVLALLALTLLAAVYIACRCYLPYSFTDPLPSGAHKALWSLLVLPSVILPIALWLCNMLTPRLSKWTLLTVLLNCCYFAAVPRIYAFGDEKMLSYLISPIAIFLICCTVTVLVRDLTGGGVRSFAVNTVFGILLTVLFALITATVTYFVITDIIPRTVICFVLPIACFVCSFGSIFSVYSRGTLILKTATLAAGCLCAGYSQVNVYIFPPLMILACIWEIIDIIKYIISRRKKNDSEPCNA